MTETLRVAGFALMAALTAFSLRAAQKETGAAVAIAAGMMLFFFAITKIAPAAAALRTLTEQAGVEEDTAKLMLKMTGMAYITEFAAQACRDAGEEGLAVKAALCGKMLLAVETLPLIMEIGRMALRLLP